MSERSAKDIRVAFCKREFANALCRRLHYSGRIVRNSTVHMAVWMDQRPLGVMQFGPSMDIRKVVSLVRDTPWRGFLELNRMAFDDELPRNSESRAIAVAFRMIRKHYPHVQWIISFADGTQCGDGTIYRASGFVLTGIRKNTTIWELGDESFTNLSARMGPGVQERLINRLSVTNLSRSTGEKTLNKLTLTKGDHALKSNGSAGMDRFRALGAKPKKGFQFRYIYFLDPAARERLTVPVIPYSRIGARGMYRGQAVDRSAAGVAQRQSASVPAPEAGGSNPTHPLQPSPQGECPPVVDPPAENRIGSGETGGSESVQADKKPRRHSAAGV